MTAKLLLFAETRALRINPKGLCLASLHFIDCIGTGVYFSTVALYLTRSSGFTASQVGIALGIGALFGLVGNTISGRVSDRLTPGKYLFALLLSLGVVYLLLPTVSTNLQLWTWSAFAFGLKYACTPPFVTLISRAFVSTARATGRALVRSYGNLGMSLGALTAVVGLATEAESFLAVSPLLDAVSFLTAASLCFAGLRDEEVLRPSKVAERSLLDPRKRVWTAPLILAVGVTTVLTLHSSLLGMGISLLISQVGQMPAILAPVIVLMNTVLVILLQVNASALVGGTLSGAVRWSRIGGIVLAGSTVILALSTQTQITFIATVGIIAAAVLVTIAELMLNSAFFYLGTGVGAERLRGRYASCFQNAHIVEGAVGPVLWGTLITAGVAGGWLVIAIIIGAAAVIYPRVMQPLRELTTDEESN